MEMVYSILNSFLEWLKSESDQSLMKVPIHKVVLFSAFVIIIIYIMTDQYTNDILEI